MPTIRQKCIPPSRFTQTYGRGGGGGRRLRLSIYTLDGDGGGGRNERANFNRRPPERVEMPRRRLGVLLLLFVHGGRTGADLKPPEVNFPLARTGTTKPIYVLVLSVCVCVYVCVIRTKIEQLGPLIPPYAFCFRYFGSFPLRDHVSTDTSRNRWV